MVDGVEHCQAFVKQLCLVLCEIADFHVMADFQHPGKGDFAHDAFHKG